MGAPLRRPGRLRRFVTVLLLAPWLAWFSVAPAAAQTLEDVQVRLVKGDTLIHVSFNGRVRYLRHAPTVPTDLLQVYLTIVGLDDPNLRSGVEESRVSPADAPGPRFTLTFPFQAALSNREIRIQFDTKVAVQVRPGPGDRSIDILVKGGAKLGGASKAAPAVSEPVAVPAPVTGPVGEGVQAPLPESAAAPGAPAPTLMRTDAGAYALTLQRVPADDSSVVKPIPKDLQSYEVFTAPLVGGGYEVDLGYFPDATAAEEVRQKILGIFPDAVVFSVEERKQQNLSAAAGAGPAPTPPADQAAVDAKADELVGAAADAVATKNYTGAIDLLNQVLLLPANASSQTAQELVGVAHERGGDVVKARADYELYLSLFPQGEGADRVRQRLANLGDLPVQPSTQPPTAATEPPPEGAVAGVAEAPKAKAGQFSAAGSISQFYYGGQTRSNTTLNAPTGINQTSLSGTTQSALVTSIDATARYRDADSDSRMVLRDTNTSSFLTNGRGTNLLSAAYIDYKNLVTTLGVRVGRQSAASAGALGLFDGISVGYSVSPRVRLNVSAGQPSDQLIATHQRFIGFDAQVDEVLPGFGVGVYGINQTVEGAVSRRALGLEARYFTPKYSVYAATDYDAAFKATNSTMIQGTMTTENQEVVTVLYDHRRIPGLDLGNALIGSNYTSIATMLQQLGYAQVQELASQVAAVSRQTVLSVSKPFSEHWQGSTDLRWSDVGPLPAIGNAPAQPGTGSQVSYSLVATGTNLYSTRDTNVFNLTVLTSAQLRGAQIAYNNLTSLMESALSLEPSVRYYTQNTNTGLHTSRLTPGVRASYHLTPVATIESEAILELSRTTGANSNESTANAFYYLGYRYEFR
jgi:hypothetical protein